MLYAALADITVLVHVLFVFFVVFGGVAVLRWQRLIWLHLPAVAWGVAVELGGWICPLTYAENYFRRLGGESGYHGSFIEHYLEPLLYPLGLSPNAHIILGLSALAVNMLIYLQLWRRSRHRMP